MAKYSINPGPTTKSPSVSSSIFASPDTEILRLSRDVSATDKVTAPLSDESYVYVAVSKSLPPSAKTPLPDIFAHSIEVAVPSVSRVICPM